MKFTILLPLLMVAGCASHPTKLPYDDIRDFRPNCAVAKAQVEYMNSQIKLYQNSHQDEAQTEEYRKYVSKAKNVIWSLRSSCPANSL